MTPNKNDRVIDTLLEVAGSSSTVEASIVELPVGDSEDSQPSSPRDSDEGDDGCAPPSPKRPAVDDAVPITDVAQVIGSHNLSASTRYSLLTNHFQPPVDYNFPNLDVHSNPSGSSPSRVSFTANRRMVVSVSRVFSSLLLDTVVPVQVC